MPRLSAIAGQAPAVIPEARAWFEAHIPEGKRSSWQALTNEGKAAEFSGWWARNGADWTAQWNAAKTVDLPEPKDADDEPFDYVGFCTEMFNVGTKAYDVCSKSPNLCKAIGGEERLATVGGPLFLGHSIVHTLNTNELPLMGRVKHPINRFLHRVIKGKKGQTPEKVEIGPDGKPVENKPKKITTSVIVIIAVAVLAIAGIVAYFYFKKKAEDKAKKEGASKGKTAEATAPPDGG